ncbi:MAG: efflux RND transporter periplasmic adaptor subunit [Candidatus Shapirobacteria bacterium]
MSHFKKWPMAVKLGLILVIIATGWFMWKSKSNSQKTATTYQTSQATVGDLIVAVTASGQVATSNSRTVTTTASGVVNKIFVTEGQTVKTGTPLMEIDLDLNGRQKLQAAYSSYQSAQNSLKTTQDRIYELDSQLVATKNVFTNQWANQSPDDPTYIQKHDAMLSAQAAYDNLQNSIKQQKAALESSRLAYQMAGATVYAPITGTVSAISLAPGMILNPTSDSANSSNIENKIAIVKTGATPSVSVSLTEIDVVKVKVGDKVTVTLDAFPDKTYTGKVMAVDSAGTVSSGVASYPTTIQLDIQDTSILPNMSATANIITNVKSSVVIIPIGALATSGEATTVRVMKNGVVENKNVEVGLTSDTEAEIISGINEGEEVVTAVINPTTTTSKTSSTSVFGGLGGGAQFRAR